MDRGLPPRTIGMVLGSLALSACCAVAGEEAEAGKKAAIPGLDLEIVATTSLRLSPAHTDAYATKLLDLTRQMFECSGSGEARKEGATYRLLVEHTGTIEVGAQPFLRQTKGRVYRDGQFLGGEERRWFMPVRRDCMVRVSLMRRAGQDYVVPLQFILKEAPTPDEEAFGGVEVAAAARAAGEANAGCPLSRDVAREKAINSIEPPALKLQRDIARRLLDVRTVRLIHPAGPTPSYPTQPVILSAEVTVENKTPWFLHRFHVKTSTRATHGRTLYLVDADFSGVLAPGKAKAVAGRATECNRSDAPANAEVTDLRWSLKGQF